VGDTSEAYDRVAREVLEQALGQTFEDRDAIPRRDAFVRDATAVLAHFVAERCGNPGFHSARFFDAVVALAGARDRIKDAARRSKVVERLIETQRKLAALEQRLRQRDEQMTALAKDDAGPVAKSLAAAEARLVTLEDELLEMRRLLAEKPSEPARAPVRETRPLDARGSGRPEDDTTRWATESTPSAPIALPGEPARRARRPASEPDEAELVELERDALRAQLEQIVEREKAVRADRNALKQERDDLAARVKQLDRSGSSSRRETELERSEALRARAATEGLKKAAEHEVALARAEVETLKQELADLRGSARTATFSAEERQELEAAVERESREATRSRRERDDLRAERDRLRSVLGELVLVRERHLDLLSSLGIPPDLAPERVQDELSRRRELVFVHEPPAWEDASRALERVRERGPTQAASEARARLGRQEQARARYGALRGALGGARGSVTDLLELSLLVAAHEEDVRWAAAMLAIAGGAGEV
jgi:chromosome segregation ATPase